jgi:hypothetical protein
MYARASGFPRRNGLHPVGKHVSRAKGKAAYGGAFGRAPDASRPRGPARCNTTLVRRAVSPGAQRGSPHPEIAEIDRPLSHSGSDDARAALDAVIQPQERHHPHPSRAVHANQTVLATPAAKQPQLTWLRERSSATLGARQDLRPGKVGVPGMQVYPGHSSSPLATLRTSFEGSLMQVCASLRMHVGTRFT